MTTSSNSGNNLGPIGLAAAAVSGLVTALVLTVGGGSTGVKLTDVPRQYAAPNAAQHRLVAYALKYGPRSSTVYVWGGTSPRGFDCSGFSQYVYRHATGVSIPRTTGSQWYDGGTRVPLGLERAGDAVYFVGAFGSRSTPGHMGIYIGNGRYAEFYSTGHRARISTLSDRSRGYVGARRWYTPARVPAKLLVYVDRLAAKYHRRIIGSSHARGAKRWAIDFVPRSKAMYRWAKRQHLHVAQLPHRTRILLRPNPS